MPPPHTTPRWYAETREIFQALITWRSPTVQTSFGRTGAYLLFRALVGARTMFSGW
jgi:hypothetical protein